MRTKIANLCSITSGGDKPDIVSKEVTNECLYPIFGNALEQEGLYGYTNFYSIDKEAVTISARGSNCGETFFRKSPFVPIVRLLTLIPNENVDARYLYYVVKNRHFRSTGSGQPQITIPQVSDCEVDIIDNINIQKKISSLLGNIDDKITNNKKINTVLESMAKILYDYWFLQFEFPNEEGKPYKSSGGKLVWNEEIERDIPEGWEVRHIGDILIESDKSKIQVNGAKEKGEFPFFTSGESILAYHEYFVDGFNILLNTGGNPDIKAYKGKCAYSTDTWCISAKQYSYILYHHLLKLMPQFEQLFFAGSGLKHLQKDALKSKYMLLPSNKILKAFNVYCSSIWEKITNCLIQNLELSSLRDFLLPLLMNGQVTFR